MDYYQSTHQCLSLVNLFLNVLIELFPTHLQNTELRFDCSIYLFLLADMPYLLEIESFHCTGSHRNILILLEESSVSMAMNRIP